LVENEIDSRIHPDKEERKKERNWRRTRSSL